MNRIAVKNAIRSASIAAKRTINRTAYRTMNAAKRVAKPVGNAAMRATARIKTGANSAGRAIRNTAKRVSVTAKNSARASARLFSAMHEKVADSAKGVARHIADKSRQFDRMNEARIKSKRYYKKRLSKNLKMARKGVISHADAATEAYKYAKSRYIKRQANKVIAVGGSVVLLGYGASEAAKRIKYNVESVLEGDDRDNGQ